MTSKNNYTLMLLGVCTSQGLAVTAISAPAPIITSTQHLSDTQVHDFGIGLTSSITKRPFVGVDDQIAALPYFSYRHNDFYIEGLDVGYNLFNSTDYSLDALATPRFYEVKSSFAGNGELDGIDSTKESYFAGLSMQLKTEEVIYTFQLLHDLLESNGNELVVQVAKQFQIEENFSLTPSLGFNYQDDKLVDHYYGVQEKESSTDRPQYEGKDSTNYNVTLNANWLYSRNIELLGQVKYEGIGNGITDSPIVDEDAIYYFTVGAIYRFH